MVMDRDQLEFRTDHLKGYDDLETVISLFGEEYIPIKKCLWYQIFSLPHRTTTVKAGDIQTDCRIHMAVPLESGGGKKNIIRTLDKISENLDYNFSKPTHFHPEQLVGKTEKMTGNPPVYNKIRGHFSSDVMAMDEAKEIFEKSADKIKATRGYINEALDPFRENRIEKKRTSIPDNQAISYCTKLN